MMFLMIVGMMILHEAAPPLRFMRYHIIILPATIVTGPPAVITRHCTGCYVATVAAIVPRPSHTGSVTLTRRLVAAVDPPFFRAAAITRPLASMADTESDAAQERLRREGLAAAAAGDGTNDPFSKRAPSVEAPGLPREVEPYAVHAPLGGGETVDADLST